MSDDHIPSFLNAPATPEAATSRPTATRAEERALRDSSPKGRKLRRRSHRAQYPTPGFYLFALLLNLIAVASSGFLLFNHLTDLNLLITASLSLLGLIVTIYSGSLRPRESNKRLRKVLVSITVLFGFLLLVLQGVNVFLNPSYFVFS